MLLSVLLAASLLYAASAAQQYDYGFDINVKGTASAFTCLRSGGYSTVFIRSYKPDGSGAVDANAVPNVNMAYQAGLGIEVYMSPSPTSSKTALKQVDEVITALINGGVTIRTLWIQVTSPLSWNKNTATNFNFIKSATDRVRITANSNKLPTDVMLWYWSVYGSGNGGESPPNFDDFRTFGSWISASVKQMGQNEIVCGIVVNRDVYPRVSVATKEMNKSAVDNRIYVGSIGL